MKPKSGLRNRSAKAKTKVISIFSAKYIRDFLIALKFNTGEERLVDFLPLLYLGSAE